MTFHPGDQTRHFPKRPRSDWEICAHCGLSLGRISTSRGDICRYCRRAWTPLAVEKRMKHEHR